MASPSKPFSKTLAPTRLLRKTQSLKQYSKGGLLDLSDNKIDCLFDYPNKLIKIIK